MDDSVLPPGLFHPAVAAWFLRTFASPTASQAKAWPSIQARRHTLIAAPTGSGKTLAAFLAALDKLVRQGTESPESAGSLPDETRVVYVSPLKALSNDIKRNLEEPLAGIRRQLAALGLAELEIRTLVRTGDTPSSQRAAMVRRPPHLLVTTPESLYLLLTSDGGRSMLSTVETVIVDEIHALVGNKRGSHLALSLERLDALVRELGHTLVRVGLSATQRPVAEVGRFLVGTDPVDEVSCTVVDVGHNRSWDLALEIPRSPLEAVLANEVWEEVYDRLAELIRAHRTTLVFVNTRRLAERLTRHLSERLGEDNVTSHHGSLARERRLDAEVRLKTGQLRALVATASLELGIDVGDVDLVCQIGSPGSISSLLQRVGRSGHNLGGTSKGRLFPLSRDDLVECTALLDAVGRGELDRLKVPAGPLDILAQQIVASVACHEWREEALFGLVRRAYPYRDLKREEFESVLTMLAQGFATRFGRRHAYLHRDRVNGRLRPTRGARLVALTNGGAIPDNADFDVLLEPGGTFVGTINEDFAVESIPGNIFQLGNASWRILRIEPGKVRVADARGEPPTIPFWLGEAPGRTDELSQAVSVLRRELGEKLSRRLPTEGDGAVPEWERWVEDTTKELAVAPGAARQIVEYLGAGQLALGTIPTQECLVLERFFDESGGMQLVLHSPFGSRLNRAWGLALRKRFCRKFNFELQAAAGDDAIVLSLGITHSFPLDEVFFYLHPETVRGVLTQALLDAPMFPVHWRWNANRALAVPRFRGGKRVAPQLQRMNAEDLIAVIFPDQLACLENIAGEREVPDHPLVEQTLRDCLHEVMDVEGLELLLRRIHDGEVRLVARDLSEPSLLAQEILSARPYAFLDDAPLEERRTQAVLSRRWMDPKRAQDLGSLDPEAIARVREEAWPEATSADELHDALVLLGFLTREEGRRGEGDGTAWENFFQELVGLGRASRLHVRPGGPVLWVAAERVPELRRVFAAAELRPLLALPAVLEEKIWSREEALDEILRGRLESSGPVSAVGLAESMGLDPGTVEAGLGRLETEGFLLRGHFSRDESAQWCERRLLARIHRLTLERLRREIEPVSASEFLRFLFRWQHLDAGEHLQGPQGLEKVLDQLEGFEAAAGAWEADLLPARLDEYDSSWLDSVCLSGRKVWLRRTRAAAEPRGERARRSGPVRSTPMTLVSRPNLAAWRFPSRGDVPRSNRGSPPAQAVRHVLEVQGASFFGDVVAASRLLRTQVEEALGELVAMGEVTSDSFAGLRALLVPSHRRKPLGEVGAKKRGRLPGVDDAGRWSLLPPGPDPGPTLATETSLSPRAFGPRGEGGASPESRIAGGEGVATIAWGLLRRWGVVFRRLLDREEGLPPWRELVQVYRRLEARGEIRGGRFVAGFSGEQYALPEAVGALRKVRRQAPQGALVSISGADPLNLTGILIPGPRVVPLAPHRLLFQDGRLVATLVAGKVEFQEELEPPRQWQARGVLLRHPQTAPPRLHVGKAAV